MADSYEAHSFSRMVEKVSDYAIFLLDRDGVIQTWNPAAEAMKGYRKDEAIGRNFSMLYTQEDQRRDHPGHNLDDAGKHGTFQESAWRQRKDGSLFWALVEIIAIRDDNGELEGFCKLTRDLTNLKHLHGGTVTCESSGLGQGSRFKLCMPVLEHDEVRPERRGALRAVDLPIASPSLSVLVVDDNQDAAEMLQFFLNTAGHRVRLAATASAAREAVRAETFDVCVLDIGLPDGNGHELAVDIRTTTAPSPMLIALSGFGMTRDRDEAAEAGFDHYFVKPVDLDELSVAFEGVDTRCRPS